MLVNPNLFKQKLITALVVVTLSVTAIYAYGNYRKLQKNHAQLSQENTVLKNELSVMIDKYDYATNANVNLSIENKQVKDSIFYAKSILNNLQSELTIIPQMRKQVANYNKLNSQLHSEKNALEKINSTLEEEKFKTSKALETKNNENLQLKEETKALKEAIEKNKFVVENSLHANAMSAAFLGKKKLTFKASKAKVIDLNFSLEKNSHVAAGLKTFYIQVIDPENNVVSDSGVTNFEDSQLIYSLKKEVVYNNQALEVHAQIKNKGQFKEGLYHINVFHKNNKVAGTKIILK